jgi:hypothetical protein
MSHIFELLNHELGLVAKLLLESSFNVVQHAIDFGPSWMYVRFLKLFGYQLAVIFVKPYCHNFPRCIVQLATWPAAGVAGLVYDPFGRRGAIRNPAQVRISPALPLDCTKRMWFAQLLAG